jgi:hypothetical protein
MTTNDNIEKKVVSILNDVRPLLEDKLKGLLESGLIDLDKEEDNYILPKEIVCAMCDYVKTQYRKPYPKRGDKIRENKILRTLVYGDSYEKL